MLEPQDRSTLMDLVRPPVGYSLDCAIGTSYSLDLLAMLFVPLAFTMLEWEGVQDNLEANVVPILESLRRHAEHYLVFCQVGQIAVPAQHSPLFAYLEKSVVEVAAPRAGGVFHPKVWALRYTSDEGVIYRLLCLSRNLTFDRSWDTALALEGTLIDRTYSIGLNRPLGDFVGALPDLALRAPTEAARERVRLVADEIRRVRFEAPPEMEIVRFWPLGLPGHSADPFPGRARRLLVISPFLSDRTLDEFAKWSQGESVLVSRPDQLDTLTPACRDRFGRIFCLDTPAAEEEDQGTPTPESEAPLQGLHAKLYVADDGWKARLWTGSANATTAAFDRNVEFLVELQGPKSRMGVEALLADNPAQPTLARLLRPYEPSETYVDTSEQRAQEQLLEAVKRSLVNGWRMEATPAEGDGFRLIVQRDRPAPALPDGVRVVYWPIAVNGMHAAELRGGAEVTHSFGPVALESLTAFLAFEIRLAGGLVPAVRFALNVPPSGVPEDREQRLLRAILHDTDRVIHFILLLLAEHGTDVPGLGEIVRRWGAPHSQAPTRWEEIPLFEALVKALHHDPSLLDHVKQLVDDLNEGAGADLLPPGFMRIWEPIWAARQELGNS